MSDGSMRISTNGSLRPWIPPAAAVLLLVAIVAVWLWEPRAGGPGVGLFISVGGAISLFWIAVGSLIVSRERRSPIGWIVLAIGLAYPLWGILGIGSAALLFRDIDSSIGPYVAWSSKIFLFPLVLLPFLFLLFPNGRALSRRWKAVGWLIAIGGVVALVATMLTPDRTLNDLVELGLTVPSPIAVDALAETGGTIAFFGVIAILAGSVLAAVSLWLRFRRSSGEERQQIRWLAFVGGTAASLLLLEIVVGVLAESVFQVGEGRVSNVIFSVIFLLFVATLAIGIPLATGIAVLRYRLYDLDVVIKKTVVFVILAVLLTTLSLGGLLALSSPLTDAVPKEAETAAVAIAMLVVGALIWPLWRFARRVADRVVFGGRSSPYEVLTEFSERVGETYSAEDVLPRMAQVAGRATSAEVARVWLRVGEELRPEASWPADAPPARAVALDQERPSDPDVSYIAEVRHHGELIGALGVTVPANDPMNPSKERLVRDLAAQAGPVMRNVLLVEDLRESRRRIVTAQDEERRKLERNIHDGAQQQLVALSVQMKLARSLIDRDPAKAGAMLDGLQQATTDALEDLRDLARGIYPPLLADKGLATALEAQARRASVAVTIEAENVDRYPQEVESAVYFCTLEALNNVAKYANASRATVRLTRANGLLTFAIIDDGRGFEPGEVIGGTGLQGMADRLDAIGGALEVRSAPGGGTTVTGTIQALGTEQAP